MRKSESVEPPKREGSLGALTYVKKDLLVLDVSRETDGQRTRFVLPSDRSLTTPVRKEGRETDRLSGHGPLCRQVLVYEEGHAVYGETFTYLQNSVVDPSNRPGWYVPEAEHNLVLQLPLFVRPLLIDVTKQDTRVSHLTPTGIVFF